MAVACDGDTLLLWEQALEAYRRLGRFRVETISGDPSTTEWLEVDLDSRRFHLECRYEPEKGEPDGLTVCGDGRTVTAWNPYSPATYRSDTQAPELCDAIQHQVCIVLDPAFRRSAYAIYARGGVNGHTLVFEGSFVMLFGDDPRVLSATWSETEVGVRQVGKTYRTVPINEVRLPSPPEGAVLSNPGWTTLGSMGDMTAAAPDLPSRLTTVRGDVIRREDLVGCPTLLEFWATWCGPCRERVHHLEQLQQAYAGRVNVVGVNRDASARIVEAFVRARGFTFPVVWDGGRRGAALFADWHVDGVPTVYLLDRDRRPVLRGHGMGWTEIQEAVESLLA